MMRNSRVLYRHTFSSNRWQSSVIHLLQSVFNILCCTQSTEVNLFIAVEELDSPVCPEDFLEVKIKEEPLEWDAVSCEAISAYVRCNHENSIFVIILTDFYFV